MNEKKQETKLLRTSIKEWLDGQTITKAEFIKARKKKGQWVHISQSFNYDTKEFKNYLNGKLVKD